MQQSLLETHRPDLPFLRRGPALLAGFAMILLGAPTTGAQPAAETPSASLQVFGAGPIGRDNGMAFPCTGLTAATPAVLCVSTAASAGGNGTHTAPYASIQAAIDAARAGDVIQVASGLYLENLLLGAFNVGSRKHLTLLGGFAPDFSRRDAAAYPVTINGGQRGPVVRLHVESNATTILDGFRITRGLGLGTSWEDGYGHGGGVYAQFWGNGHLVISHNVIYGNQTANHTTADSRGGGIFTDYHDYDGTSTGAIVISDNWVHDNLAGKGAGVFVQGARATLLRNRIENNISHHDHGGGVYVSTRATQVEQNLIRGNVVGATQGYGWGGGIIIAGAAADLRGNVITDNYTPTIGSGVFWDEGATGTMRNDLIFANRCPRDGRSGAAIYVDGGPGGPSRVTISFATIADHQCPGTTGGAVFIQDGSTVTLDRVILWGNTRDFGLDGGSFTIRHSITAESGEGNRLVDPLFADPTQGDYHLRSEADLGAYGGTAQASRSSQ